MQPPAEQQDTEPIPVIAPQPIVHVTVVSPEQQQAERIPNVPSQVLPPRRDIPRPETIGANNSPERTKTIRPEHETPPENNSPDEQKTTPSPNKNQPDSRATIPVVSPDLHPDATAQPGGIPAPTGETPADRSEYRKKGKIGRQRKYDVLGADDIEPVKEVVLFRHQLGRHWPGLSRDMELYYERFYFTKPSKRKDGKDYDKHAKCWERRERWINGESDEA